MSLALALSIHNKQQHSGPIRGRITDTDGSTGTPHPSSGPDGIGGGTPHPSSVMGTGWVCTRKKQKKYPVKNLSLPRRHTAATDTRCRQIYKERKLQPGTDKPFTDPQPLNPKLNLGPHVYHLTITCALSHRKRHMRLETGSQEGLKALPGTSGLGLRVSALGGLRV